MIKKLVIICIGLLAISISYAARLDELQNGECIMYLKVYSTTLSPVSSIKFYKSNAKCDINSCVIEHLRGNSVINIPVTSIYYLQCKL